MPYEFRMIINNQVGFHALLHSEQCIAHTGPDQHGPQCNRTVIIGEPYCWSHLLSIKHLRIKNSHIPGAGKGLFALMRTKDLPADNIVFHKGDIIATYTGEHINLATRKKRYPGEMTAPYAVENTKDDFIDAALERGYAALVNHGTNQQSNVKWVHSHKNGGEIRMKATKNIPNDTELRINYGRIYRFQDNHRTVYVRG